MFAILSMVALQSCGSAYFEEDQTTVYVVDSNRFAYLNSFEGYYMTTPLKPDMRIDTIDVAFDWKQEMRIEELADSVDFWSIPENPASSELSDPTPGPSVLRIQTKHHDHTVRWDGDIYNTQAADRIYKLRSEIRSMVRKMLGYEQMRNPGRL